MRERPTAFRYGRCTNQECRRKWHWLHLSQNAPSIGGGLGLIVVAADADDFVGFCLMCGSGCEGEGGSFYGNTDPPPGQHGIYP